MQKENLRVPVISPSGEPLIPTTASRARRWIKQGKAKPFWNDLGIWCVQLLLEPSGTKTQSIVIASDPGKRYSDKALQAPETHAVDAVAIAATHFVQYKPFCTTNTRRYIWVGEVVITPAVFKVISKPRMTRRRLHNAVPSKGGIRERYGGSTTPYKARIGDLIGYSTKSKGKTKKVIGYCSGSTGKNLSLSDASWSRLGRFADSKCRILARNTGLVISGTLSPTQLPSYPSTSKASAYGRSTSEI